MSADRSRSPLQSRHYQHQTETTLQTAGAKLSRHHPDRGGHPTFLPGVAEGATKIDRTHCLCRYLPLRSQISTYQGVQRPPTSPTSPAVPRKRIGTKANGDAKFPSFKNSPTPEDWFQSIDSNTGRKHFGTVKASPGYCSINFTFSF